MATIAFIIPYWGGDKYRQRAFWFLQNSLFEAFSGSEWQDDPPMAYTGTSGINSTRSSARNDLAARAIEEGAEVLVFNDADSIPMSSALYDGLTFVMTKKTWMFPYTTYYNLTEKGSEDFMESPPWEEWRPQDGYEYEYVFPGPDPNERPSAVGGCVIVHRDLFKKVRGYDERFKGWGGEDRAFALTLETFAQGVPQQIIRYPGPIYHLWHPAPEYERFDHPNWVANQELLRRYQEAHPWPRCMTDLLNER